MEDTNNQKKENIDVKLKNQDKEQLKKIKSDRIKNKLNIDYDQGRQSKLVKLFKILKREYKNLIVNQSEKNENYSEKLIEIIEYKYNLISDEELKRIRDVVVNNATLEYYTKRNNAFEKIDIINILVKEIIDINYKSILIDQADYLTNQKQKIEETYELIQEKQKIFNCDIVNNYMEKKKPEIFKERNKN